ncbi:MAG: OmpA family protein [Saprospiraceae bacterium]|nr:OmpA family protein [Saprospiraceae bacterium]
MGFFQDNRLDIILYQDFITVSQRSLSSTGAAAIDKLAKIIAEYPSLEILIEGHTDNSISQTGEALGISTQRAVVVCTYLVDEGGINGNQLTVCGRGNYYPRVSNQTLAGRSLNNRVEISLRPPYQQLLAFLDE